MAQTDVEKDKKASKRTTDKRGGDKKGAEKKPASQANPISRYFRETRGELRKVTWPTQEESIRLTAIVIGVTIAMSIFLFLFDFVFSNGIEGIIQQLAL